jgi:hypothetical protein
MNLIKTGEGFSHAIAIERNSGEVDSVILWCKTNFEDTWRWQICRSSSPRQPGHYTFFFNNNSDYMAFVLKYG